VLAALPQILVAMLYLSPAGESAPPDDPAEPAEETVVPAPPSALEAFKNTQSAVLEKVRKKASDATIEALVDSFLDYSWIAQQSLGGQGRYEKRCEPRCAEFEALLAKLIRKNYLRRIHDADKGGLDYLGEETRKGGTKAKVDTLVTFKNEEGALQYVKVSYVMHWVEGAWMTRNIITDGVSLAKTYRYEFNKLLREGGIDRLIAQLEGQIAELAKAD